MSTSYKGSCHCQQVKYKIQMDEPIKRLMACNCSICSKKGTLLTFIPKENFELISGEGNLSDYQFGKKSVHHYFCSTCGVTSFASGKMPDGTEVRAINARCLEGVDIDGLQIEKFNGKEI